MDHIYTLIEEVIVEEDLIYGVLSNVRSGVEKSFKKLTLKPVLIKKEKRFNWNTPMNKRLYMKI